MSDLVKREYYALKGEARGVAKVRYNHLQVLPFAIYSLKLFPLTSINSCYSKKLLANLKLTKEYFGSTRPQVRNLSPRLLKTNSY
tara:strand:+ start:79 stop:333 length:255 start_codon:yes stop_codon:yes gene_type:complete